MTGDEMVELRLPARPGLIGVVRHLAGDLAARAGLGGEAVSDVRMAVDEAVTMLVARATGEVPMRCQFVIGTNRLEAAIAAQVSHTTTDTLKTATRAVTIEAGTTTADLGTTRGAALTSPAYVWRIMHSLVDELHLHIKPPPHHPSDGSGAEGPSQRAWTVIQMIKGTSGG